MTEISFNFTWVALNAYHVQVINIFGNIVKLLLFLWLYLSACTEAF